MKEEVKRWMELARGYLVKAKDKVGIFRKLDFFQRGAKIYIKLS